MYRRLRDEDPVQLLPQQDTWVLTRHADCVTVLRDPRFSSQQAHRLRQRAAELAPTMLNTDPPEHGRLRSAVATAWNAASLSAAGARIEAVVGDAARALADRATFDLISEYANPVAAGTLAAALGLPAVDYARLQRWLDEASGNVDPMATPQAQRKGGFAAARLRHYFAELTEERRAAPGDELLSSLATAAGLGSDERLEACNLLMIGGYEPLANLIGNGMLALLQHPDQLARLEAISSWPGAPSTSCCASTHRSRSSPASLAKTSRSAADRSLAASRCCRCWRPPTATPPSSISPTSSTSGAAPIRTWHSAPGRTSVLARSSRSWSRPSRSRRW